MTSVRVATAADAAALADIHAATWGSPIVVGHGVSYDLTTLPTLVCEVGATIVGALAYHVADDALEIVSISAVQPRHGVGTALLSAAIDVAKAADLGSIWLVTTNDNLDALRFYQRRGLRIVSVEADAVDRSRRIKPQIPLTGQYGIDMHDELTLRMPISPAATV